MPEPSITKDEAVEKLNAKGYEAVYGHGLVNINIAQNDLETFCEEVEAFLKEINYTMSRGYSRWHNTNTAQEA